MDQKAVEVVADIATSCGRCAAQRAAVFIEPALSDMFSVSGSSNTLENQG